MKTILVFEPLSGGHRENFIRWLREAAPEYSGCRLVFFTAEDTGEMKLEPLGWWQIQKRLYTLFRQACEQHRPDHVLILELTRLELPLMLFGSPVPLSAILFVQYPELAHGLKFFSKHWKTRLLLARAPVHNFFLLNGENSARFLSEHFPNRCRFIPIADPAPEGTADPNFSFGRPGKRICLFFGSISRRKGAEVLLDALHRIDPAVADANTFVFSGAPEADYRAEFKQACEKLQSARPNLDLIVNDRFVSDRKMMAMFEAEDASVLKRFKIPFGRNLVLPHPVLCPPVMEQAGTDGTGRLVVGVAGYYRPEKGMDELVGLLKEKLSGVEILLGVPNPEAAAHLNVETVSTKSDADYFAMIARCDVLVFNHCHPIVIEKKAGMCR